MKQDQKKRKRNTSGLENERTRILVSFDTLVFLICPKQQLKLFNFKL